MFGGNGSGCEEDSQAGKGLRRRKRNGITPREREEVMLDAGYSCVYCGTYATEVDHIIPFSRGGACYIENYAASCWLCNKEKRDLTPDEWAEVRRSRGKPWPIPSEDDRIRVMRSRYSDAEIEPIMWDRDALIEYCGGIEKIYEEMTMLRDMEI